MYYGYSIISGKEKSNYIKGGDYTRVNSPAEFVSSETCNFTVMRMHSERKRIMEIDNMLKAVEEEYTELSKSVTTASAVVKEYIKQRIIELQEQLDSLEHEKRQLLAAAC